MQLIPSEYMREYLESVNFTFTDFQRATLIWNVPTATWQEKLEALKELADTTKDVGIQNQIRDRLVFEEKQFAVFADNATERYVYVVEECQDYSSCEFFAAYDRAVLYAVKYMQEYEVECSIKKQLIVKTAEDERREGCKYEGAEVSGVRLNKKGEIIRVWSYELPQETRDLVNEDRSERFEYSFVEIPFEMPVGASVIDVVTGNYGILAQGKAEWDRYLQEIKEKSWHVDFSDVQVMVYQITEQGCWSHHHINPLRLDVEFPPYIPDDEERQALRRAMEAMGDYLYHRSIAREDDGRYVLKYAKQYAEVCSRKRHPYIKEGVEIPEDIMF